MDKRIIAVFTAFALTMGCLCLRLYTVCQKGTEYVSSSSHYFTIQLDRIRGDIIDCNGINMTDSEYDNVVVAKPTIKALNSLDGVLDSEQFADVKKRMEKLNAVSINIGKLTVVQNPDILTLKVNNRYAKRQLAQHLIGYVDIDGKGVAGLEACYDNILSTDKCLTARFSADAYGRIISGSGIEILNSKAQTGSVELTVDSIIQKNVEDSLDSCGVEEGGAVVVDLKNGAIKALASRPDYNADNISDYINSPKSPFVNRAVQSYAVGSIFKVAVACAALESGIENMKYTCNGSCKVNDIVFHCNKKTAHGELNMEKALECSCNCYFIKLAQKIGAKQLLETVSLLGFGHEIKLNDMLCSKQGDVPTEELLQQNGALANFSFGQGRFTATMLQLAEMMSAVANKGKYYTPYLIEKVTDKNGKIKEKHSASYPVVAISKSTADTMSKYLESVVEKGNAVKAKLNNGIKAAGKTATAQTGTFDANGVEICNTWFGGFFPVDNPKYVVIILKQGGSSGAEDCAPVFKKIADKICATF